jgi:hypothetical protein
MRSEGEKLLPEEALLDLPEVCSLPSEGGAMDEAQRRKPLRIMPSEVAVGCLVGVEPKELSDDLDGEDLRAGEFRGGAALAQGSLVFEIRSSMRQKTETMKVLRSNQKTSAAFGAIESTTSVGRSSLLLKSSKKLAHGVNWEFRSVGELLSIRNCKTRELRFYALLYENGPISLKLARL